MFRTVSGPTCFLPMIPVRIFSFCNRRGRLLTASNESKWWKVWWRPYMPFWCWGRPGEEIKPLKCENGQYPKKTRLEIIFTITSTHPPLILFPIWLYFRSLAKNEHVSHNVNLKALNFGWQLSLQKMGYIFWGTALGGQGEGPLKRAKLLFLQKYFFYFFKRLSYKSEGWCYFQESIKFGKSNRESNPLFVQGFPEKYVPRTPDLVRV